MGPSESLQHFLSCIVLLHPHCGCTHPWMKLWSGEDTGNHSQVSGLHLPEPTHRSPSPADTSVKETKSCKEPGLCSYLSLSELQYMSRHMAAWRSPETPLASSLPNILLMALKPRRERTTDTHLLHPLVVGKLSLLPSWHLSIIFDTE